MRIFKAYKAQYHQCLTNDHESNAADSLQDSARTKQGNQGWNKGRR